MLIKLSEVLYPNELFAEPCIKIKDQVNYMRKTKLRKTRQRKTRQRKTRRQLRRHRLIPSSAIAPQYIIK